MLLWRLIFYCLGHIAKRAIRHWTDHQGDRETGSSGLLHMATIATIFCTVIHGSRCFLLSSLSRFFRVSPLSLNDRLRTSKTERLFVLRTQTHLLALLYSTIGILICWYEDQSGRFLFGKSASLRVHLRVCT